MQKTRTRWSEKLKGIALIGLIVASGLSAAQQSRPRAAAPGRQSAKTITGSHRFGLEKPLPKAPGVIRLATYNTLNVFDHVDDPNLQGEFDDLPMATPRERLQGLANAIREIDADIIALQEIESLEALTWFRDTFLSDAGYKHLASKDVGYYRGVECSIMSRLPITSVRVWLNESLDNVKREGPGWARVPAGERVTFQRSPLMVEIKVNDRYSLTIFSVHHKAGREFDWHREAEALRIAHWLSEFREKEPNRNVIVMGDFNAAPWDKSVRTYLRAGMIDTMAYRLIDRDSPESPLYKTHESDRVLDFILMNSAAFCEYVPGSGFVYGTLAPSANYDYQTDQPPPGYASDHYPVVVDIVPKDQR